MKPGWPKSAETELFSRIGLRARELLLPYLIALYARPSGADISTRQIGTGFVVSDGSKRVLLTARHVLFGHQNDEDPFTKHIVFEGRLRGLFELRTSEVISGTHHDIVGLSVNELGQERCLPGRVLSIGSDCKIISVVGFLSRDFRRNLKTGVLSPQPFIFTNARIDRGGENPTVSYPRRHFRNTRSGLKMHAPRPEGLSGAPMLNSLSLLKGKVQIVGLFTDYVQERGRAYGESAAVVTELLKGFGFK